jgi:protein O-GlcNAc transferase
MTIPQAFALAIQHHRAGRLGDAEVLYRQILAAQPNHADALHHLGVIAQQAGLYELAVERISQALVLDPNNPFAHYNLAEAYRTTGQLAEAVAAFRRALGIKPDYLEAQINLGVALGALGRLNEAITAYRSALRLSPDAADAHSNLGIALRDRGQIDEAVAACRRALELRPDYPEAHNNLGNALRDRGQFDEAVAEYRRAIHLKPELPGVCSNLGGALKDLGRLEEALHEYRRALRPGDEDPSVHSNLIYTLHFHPGHDTRSIAEEQRRWNRQFSDSLKRFILPHKNDRSPERRLRIGYVSPDLRDHVVGRNLLPLFRCHDRRNVEIICYSGAMRPDRLTDEFRQYADQWRDTVGMADEAFTGMIRRDGVDILVDLTQHMAGNRLPMFARQPAPVQASFAGYPESTGLAAIEYRISDQYLERGSADEGSGREERVCLIDSFWCYDPIGLEVEVNGLPAMGSGTITFGSLGNFGKVNEPVLKLWARVLEAVAGSRILIWSPGGSHRQRARELFQGEGIEADRIQFTEFRPRREYLELYHRVDVVLDTFPYNGHTTSLDALWMGAPVVSLAGDRPVSRAGLSQLTNIGLPELVAHSEAEYVSIAHSLAMDLPRLAQLRTTLRARMKASVLMDAAHFTLQIEQAYRKMWRTWADEQPPGRDGI